MSNLTTTNVDLGNVVLKDAELGDGPLAFAGPATVAAGTILARDSVSLEFVPFVKGGVVNENGIPKAILTYDVTYEGVGAGTVPIRAAISGIYRTERLIINADGDGSNVDAAVKDQLRDYGLVPVDVQELNIPDNQ